MLRPTLCECSSDWQAQTYKWHLAYKSFGSAFLVLEQLLLIFGQLRPKGKLKEYGFCCTNRNNNKTLQPKLHFSGYLGLQASENTWCYLFCS